MPRTRAVPRALDEVKARDGRKSLQLIHHENQLTVHHAVNHEAMLIRIDVRHDEAPRDPEIVEGRRGDRAHLVLKGSPYVKDEPELVG